jgi:CDP-diacylglycerol--serine O-phosphatidyltransferase
VIASRLPSNSPSPEDRPPRIKIYFFPNLMTAGNLFCGFLALTKIVEADITSPDFYASIQTALLLILLACIFDLLDGQVARMVGEESSFGREFDSLADVISFGAAPAFLLHRVVLKDISPQHPELGWLVASIYLICGALRLARFNCLAELPQTKKSDEFIGFPIPMAAGLVASITYFLMKGDEQNFMTSPWRFALPVLMLFLSVMMVSEVRYPAFKSINLRTRRTFAKMVVSVIIIGSVVILRDKILPLVLPVIFSAYLVYGFIRPWISKKMRKEIEEIAGDDEFDEVEDVLNE